MSKRLSRTVLILAATAGLAASGGTASASLSSDTTSSGGDNAPGGAVTKVDDHRPAGVGHGRKVG
jgi:ABC-type glycerol-3-phosphate transport system substrate-binding protein